MPFDRIIQLGTTNIWMVNVMLLSVATFLASVISTRPPDAPDKQNQVFVRVGEVIVNCLSFGWIIIVYQSGPTKRQHPQTVAGQMALILRPLMELMCSEGDVVKST